MGIADYGAERKKKGGNIHLNVAAFFCRIIK